MAKNANINEEKTAGASYVLNFYQEVASLTHNYANYENLLLELKEKYNGQEEKITIEERDALKAYCQTLRYYIVKTYIAYSSIVDGIKKAIDPDVKLFSDILKNQYVLKAADLENYVVKLNAFIISDVIKHLLESSNDIIAQLYKEEESGTGENVGI